MKKYFKLLLILGISATSLVSQDIKSSSDAINIAGKQRMLTQKILKEYAMVGMNNQFGDPTSSLKESIESFELSLTSLSSFIKNKEVKKELSNSKTLWTKTKKMAQDTPSLKSVTTLQINLDKLLLSNDKITNILISETKSTRDDMINVARKQRMYSQKLAGLYMLKVWGVKDEKFDDKMKKSLDDFKSALTKLEKYPKNTDKISTLLKSSKKAFLFFDIMSRSKSKFIPSLIYKKSLDILNDMNSVVSLYSKIEQK